MDTGQDRPTLWIALTAILTLAAIALGIWALTTKSDLDDANDKLDAAEQRLAAERDVATKVERAERRIALREERAFRRLHRKLVGTRQEAKELNSSLQKESRELEAARRATENAKGQAQKREAELNEARQEADLAIACARGAADAINHFFVAETAQVGAQRAMRQLERQQRTCSEVTR